MISICIPIYNYHISPLVYELTLQLNKTSTPIEIVLIDDCSNNEFKQLNASSCSNHTYIELDMNVGRAAIRNLFLKYAKYNYLLFLDCDSSIISKDFLSEYIDALNEETNTILCGGRIYDNIKPERNKILHWKYGIKRESQSYEARNLLPNKSFMTNNFLIKKKILAEIKFDERLKEYGHEDTLFGFRLKEKGIAIKHIENPVLHADIETNAGYLKKTELGILNLISILKFVDYNPNFIEDVSILHFYYQLKTKKLTGIIRLKFRFLKPIIKYLLLKGYINLWLFDYYKFGLFVHGMRKLP